MFCCLTKQIQSQIDFRLNCICHFNKVAELFFTACVYFNSLLTDHTCKSLWIRMLQSNLLVTFKKKLKTYLFKTAFNPQTCLIYQWASSSQRALFIVIIICRYWQDLGYLIVYVTGRPDMQKQRVVAWLSQHNFPHGIVSFCDGLVHDPLRHKANFLKSLINEVREAGVCLGRRRKKVLEVSKSWPRSLIRPTWGSLQRTAPPRTSQCTRLSACLRSISTSWEGPQRECSTSVR